MNEYDINYSPNYYVLVNTTEIITRLLTCRNCEFDDLALQPRPICPRCSLHRPFLFFLLRIHGPTYSYSCRRLIYLWDFIAKWITYTCVAGCAS